MNDRHVANTKNDFLWEGNNHFDLYVFRNVGMFGADEMTLRHYNLKDIENRPLS